jgi:hypothetical protein
MSNVRSCVVVFALAAVLGSVGCATSKGSLGSGKGSGDVATRALPSMLQACATHDAEGGRYLLCHSSAVINVASSEGEATPKIMHDFMAGLAGGSKEKVTSEPLKEHFVEGDAEGLRYDMGENLHGIVLARGERFASCLYATAIVDGAVACKEAVNYLLVTGDAGYEKAVAFAAKRLPVGDITCPTCKVSKNPPVTTVQDATTQLMFGQADATTSSGSFAAFAQGYEGGAKKAGRTVSLGEGTPLTCTVHGQAVDCRVYSEGPGKPGMLVAHVLSPGKSEFVLCIQGTPLCKSVIAVAGGK